MPDGLARESQEVITRRFKAMGLETEPLPGGRTVLAHLRLQRTRFDTTTQPIRIEHMTLASVGLDRAKCMQPRPLFQLPILRILGCHDATTLEARIHLAWQRHIARLEEVEQWLRSVGVEYSNEAERSIVSFPISGEGPDVRARMIDAHRVILPTRGPLSGIVARRADDRVLPIDRRLDSGIDLEIQISGRLEELARLDSRLAQQSRLESLDDEPRGGQEPAGERRPVELVVGPRATQERAGIESLRLRGYQVETASGEREAILTFDRCSPVLLLSDVSLGRSEGISLIQSLRQVPGIEEVPVILMDSHKREDRKEAARRMDAAGYLVYPIDVARIAERLAKIVASPGRRRFTRYAQRLPVKLLQGQQEPLLTNSISRGGMFVVTDGELDTHALQDCRLGLPEIGANLRVEAEVLYQAQSDRQGRQGVGVCFHGFPDADEPVLIEYLRNLHPECPAPAI